MMRVQLSLSFHFYLLYLLLNSCGGNYAFWRQYMLVKRSRSFRRKHGFYISRYVSAKQSSWLQNLWTGAGTCVQKAVTCKHEAKGHHSEHLPTEAGSFQSHQRSPEENNFVSRYFHRSYLKANKASKSEGIKKVEHAYHFWKCADAADWRLWKLVHTCRS